MTYEVGDQVRIWVIFGRPVGTIVHVSEDEPTKYRIEYVYPDSGKYYCEDFESQDLSLYEKRGRGCKCGLKFAPSGGKHSSFCDFAGQTEEGSNGRTVKIKDEGSF